MNALKIIRLIVLAVAVVGAFVAIPEAALIMAVLGLVMGVMGDMAELGEYARSEHQDVGDYARKLGIKHIYTLGEMSLHAQAGHDLNRHCHDFERLVTALKNNITEQQTTVLIKGSRSARMERVVEELKKLGDSSC